MGRRGCGRRAAAEVASGGCASWSSAAPGSSDGTWSSRHWPAATRSRSSIAAAPTASSSPATTAWSDVPATGTRTCPRWRTASGTPRWTPAPTSRARCRRSPTCWATRGGRHLVVSSVSAYAPPSRARFRRGRAARRARRPDGRGRHGRDLRRPQGPLRARRRRPLRPGDRGRPADVRRRTRRLHLALPVVGDADGPGRRGPGARPGRRPGTGHRRPRHGGLDGAAAGGRPVRRLPRRQPGAALLLAGRSSPRCATRSRRQVRR